jgi:hypothetical protein
MPYKRLLSAGMLQGILMPTAVVQAVRSFFDFSKINFSVSLSGCAFAFCCFSVRGCCSIAELRQVATARMPWGGLLQ